MPNRKVLESNILNYSKGKIVDYIFEICFSHEIPNSTLIKKVLIPSIDEFYEEHKKILPEKPEFGMSKLNRLERWFYIRIFF